MFQKIAIVLLSLFGLTMLQADNVVFQDSMDYSDDFDIQAEWNLVDGAMPKVMEEVILTPLPLEELRPKPKGKSFMALDNGVIERKLKSTPEKGWTLSFYVLSTEYSRGQSIYLLDSTGRQGYGINLNTALVDQFGGEGLVTIKKLNLSVDDSKTWDSFQSAENLAQSENTGHPITGYPVTSYDSNQDTAIYATDNWLDFMQVELRWKASSGELSAYVDGVLMAQAKDKDFDQFAIILIHGNTTGYFDEIVVTTM